MTRRTRTLSGVFALVAMTFSLAEAGVASMCAMTGVPDTDVGMDMMSGPPASGSMDGHGVADAVHQDGAHGSPAGCVDCSEMAGGDPDRPDDPCPFGPMMGSGCAATASLRSSSPVFSASMAEHGYRVRGPTSSPDSRPADRLFHPPRA